MMVSARATKSDKACEQTTIYVQSAKSRFKKIPCNTLVNKNEADLLYTTVYNIMLHRWSEAKRDDQVDDSKIK